MCVVVRCWGFTPSLRHEGGLAVKMTGVDEILNYKKNPDDDFYALLGCDENSSVSFIVTLIFCGKFCLNILSCFY